MNDLILLYQTSNKLDELVAALAFVAKDLKQSLEADNAELKEIRNEIAELKEAMKGAAPVKKVKG